MTLPLVPKGRTWFVKESEEGCDANSGTSPSSPFRTAKKAWEMCVSGREDFIVLLPLPEPAKEEE